MMNRQDRAKQFAPFDALKGLREALAKKEYDLGKVERGEHSEELDAEISEQFTKIRRGDRIALTCYQDGYYVKVMLSLCCYGYLSERAEQEKNKKVKDLLQKDIAFLDGIQLEMATARQFLFVARCRGMNAQQVFHYANAVQKAIHEQGFEVHRLEKSDIKRLLALYFDASLFGEQIPDNDNVCPGA